MKIKKKKKGMYQRGNSWYSDFQYKGGRYVQCHGAVSQSIAEEEDIKLRAEVLHGVYKKEADDPRFDRALDDYLQYSEVINQPSTFKRNCHSANYLKEHFGPKKISQIENNEISMRRYIENRKKQIMTKQIKQGRIEAECSFTSVNRELALMRSMFNRLIRSGKAQYNPVSLVKMFEEVCKERVLTPEETVKIFDTIESLDVRYQHMREIILTGLNTACRLNEILGMKKSWIFLEECIMQVPRCAQKRKIRNKRVPVNSVLLPIVKKCLEMNPESEYLFVNPKTGTRYFRIQRSWDSILKKAGIEGRPGVDKLRLHDLRHTAASNLAKAGKDIKFIAQYLGHSDVKTTARYVHYNDKDLLLGAEELVKHETGEAEKSPTIFTTLKVVSK